MLKLEPNGMNIALAMVLMDKIHLTWKELLETFPFRLSIRRMSHLHDKLTSRMTAKHDLISLHTISLHPPLQHQE